MPTIRFITIEHMSTDPAGPGSAHHYSVEGAEWFGLVWFGGVSVVLPHVFAADMSQL